MFCYQCEQTKDGKGCTIQGVCGKDDNTATLQDLLLYVTKGIGQYAKRAFELGLSDPAVNRFVVEALFTTITNVNFDPERLLLLICKANDVKAKARKMYEEACKSKGVPEEHPLGPAEFAPASGMEGLLAQGRAVGVMPMRVKLGDTAAGIIQFTLHGLKGVAAYTDHAKELGVEDEAHYASIHEILDFLAKEESNMERLSSHLFAVGKVNYKAMELLDRANTSTYGHPEPAKVRVTPVKGKAILVSGHDLHDLEELLKQTEGKDINIYTHGEMLPTHAYPKLKKYAHFKGNFGGAWQNQIQEFPNFAGPILLTTNCIQRPQDSYKRRIFTSGLVAWPGVTHIKNRDFTQLIEAAQIMDGFVEDGQDKEITVGFGRNAILENAGKIMDLMARKKIRHIFLVGGCDGAKPGRNYYTEFVQSIPQDCIVMTLACGKYRFNKLEFGDIEGIPRLLDVGQCNDAYSAIQVAIALSNAFGVTVNELPLSLVLSWYEQKAVAVLLTLLDLGVKNIRIGPSLPASLTPDVVSFLVDKFGLKPIAAPDQDLKDILATNESSLIQHNPTPRIWFSHSRPHAPHHAAFLFALFMLSGKSRLLTTSLRSRCQTRHNTA